jgi:hypothetical protein
MAPSLAADASPARALRGIGAATRWLILVHAVLALATIALQVFGILAINAFETRSVGIDALESYDAIFSRISIVSLIALAVSGVCWLVWQYRAAASVPSAALRRSPGWHVASWFIPFVSLWFPFQNISDIADGSRAALGGRIRGAWWTLWLAAGFASTIAASVERSADTLPSLSAGLTISILSKVCLIGAAALAWIVVARITDAIDPKS